MLPFFENPASEACPLFYQRLKVIERLRDWRDNDLRRLVELVDLIAATKLNLDSELIMELNRASEWFKFAQGFTLWVYKSRRNKAFPKK